MALIFFDGCQWGTNPSADAGYDTGACNYISSPNPPFGDRFCSSHAAQKILGSNVGTLIFGFFWKTTTLTAFNHFNLRDGANVQATVKNIVSGGNLQLQIINGSAGAVLGSSTHTFSVDVWRHVEWKIPFGNSVNVICKVDGVEEINVSGVDTTTTANNFITNIIGVAGSSACNFYCLYLLDTTGTSQNDFIGPQRASILHPTGSDTGAFNDFAASAGTRTSCVDDPTTPNDDADYVFDNTAGHKQSFTMEDLPVSPAQINGLALYGRWRRDDAGPHTARLFLRESGGTINNEPTESVAATYENKVYMHGISSFTSSPWTKSEIDGLQPGIELVS